MILILSDQFEPNRGGAIDIARIQAAALASQNEVHVLTSLGKTGFGDAVYKVFVFDLGYNPKLRNYLGIYHPRAIKILKQHLETYQYELCYLHNIHTCWSYAVLKTLKAARIKTILTFHDVSSVTPFVKLCNMKSARDYSYSLLREIRDAKWFFNPFRRILVKKYLSLASETRAVSQALADFLTANGIRVDRVARNKLPAMNFKANPVYENTIFFGGRLSTAKGALQAIEYLKILKDEHELTPRLIVAGNRGVITEKMLYLAKDRKVENQLQFLGWLGEDAYQKAMSRSSVVIVPSICFDSLPNVVLEAMRAGTPVVATMYGGSSEMVEEGKTWFIRDPQDLRGFSWAIARAIKNAPQLGSAGFRKFEQEFCLK